MSAARGWSAGPLGRGSDPECTKKRTDETQSCISSARFAQSFRLQPSRSTSAKLFRESEPHCRSLSDGGETAPAESPGSQMATAAGPSRHYPRQAGHPRPEPRTLHARRRQTADCQGDQCLSRHDPSVAGLYRTERKNIWQELISATVSRWRALRPPWVQHRCRCREIVTSGRALPTPPVRGHREVPTDGHLGSPLMAKKCPHSSHVR